MLLLLSISSTFITYAVIPEQYENEIYSKEDVQRIASIEKGNGISFAYKINERNLFFVFLPLLILFIINVLLDHSREKTYNKSSKKDALKRTSS